MSPRSAGSGPDDEPVTGAESGRATRPRADERSAVPEGPWSAQINMLGEFIRAQRQLAKLSLREMASMTSVSNAYLSQVERGLHQPSLKVLHSIADALQLSTEQLLTQAGWNGGGAAGRSSGRTSGRPPADTAAPGGSVEDAIARDPRLSAEQRAALLSVYRSYVVDG